ncbi:MAG TPA: response regulator [Elusimicrobiota bacterium]|nr:response regulator [Elusimicrobiota bacterium]
MSGDKRIVLIADDEPDSLELLKLLLERQNHDVITATNGREAIERVIQFQPDLVLLDIMMPEIDGLAVCRHIKENDLLKRIKVILFSAKEKEKAQGDTTAKHVGADAFLPKPLDPELLASVTAKMLAQQDREGPKLANKLSL